MQLAVEEKCEFLPFLSPKKVKKKSSLVIIPVSFNSITVLSIHINFVVVKSDNVIGLEKLPLTCCWVLRAMVINNRNFRHFFKISMWVLLFN